MAGSRSVDDDGWSLRAVFVERGGVLRDVPSDGPVLDAPAAASWIGAGDVTDGAPAADGAVAGGVVNMPAVDGPLLDEFTGQ